MREAFDKARAHAASGQPTVLFFDELESLAPVRDANRPHEARVVAQLLTLLDGAASDTGRFCDNVLIFFMHSLCAAYGSSGYRQNSRMPSLLAGAQGHLTFIGATTDPNSIDPALRRLGRLDHEVAIGLPSAEVRMPAHSCLPGCCRIDYHCQ